METENQKEVCDNVKGQESSKSKEKKKDAAEDCQSVPFPWHSAPVLSFQLLSSSGYAECERTRSPLALSSRIGPSFFRQNYLLEFHNATNWEGKKKRNIYF